MIFICISCTCIDRKKHYARYKPTKISNNQLPSHAIDLIVLKYSNDSIWIRANPKIHFDRASWHNYTGKIYRLGPLKPSGERCLLYEASIKNGRYSGTFIRYYHDGKVLLRGNYCGGEKNGKFTIFHHDNIVEVNYYCCGERCGVWIKFDEYGNIIEKIDYGLREECDDLFE